jgi:hypothetical protein
MNSVTAKRFQQTILLSLIALIMLILAPHTLAGKQVGYVKDMRGDWFLDNRPLRRGQALPDGGRITYKPSGESHSFIAIGDLNARTVIYKNCDNPGECNQPIILTGFEAPEPSLVTTVVGIVMDAFFRKLPEHRSAISRGDALREGVVKLEGNKVELSPAFANMKRGKYLLRFVPISRKPDAKRDASLNMVSFYWDPQKPAKLEVKGLTRGAYELQQLKLEDWEPQEPGTEAWILIADAAEYDKALCSYQQAVAITSQWGKDTRPTTIRDFLRAYLEHLAATGKK